MESKTILFTNKHMEQFNSFLQSPYNNTNIPNDIILNIAQEISEKNINYNDFITQYEYGTELFSLFQKYILFSTDTNKLDTLLSNMFTKLKSKPIEEKEKQYMLNILTQKLNNITQDESLINKFQNDFQTILKCNDYKHLLTNTPTITENELNILYHLIKK
jgi:hypothetical protein